VKWLIDERLHVSLLELAHRRGHIADHVNYLGRGSSKDWELMAIVMEHDYTFVTNNRLDFLALYGKKAVHAGLVVIVPNVTPARQRGLFNAVLEHVDSRHLINTVVEVNYIDQQIECVKYAFPKDI
jgi:predicted nuclease of predicted toxin-antitoxin system